MSQRVWACACGWKSIAENVVRADGTYGAGGRGEAPPHCRRCKSTKLTVSSEKHPKITHVCKNPKCRKDFLGHVGAKHCEACRIKDRGEKIWQGRKKYIWTPERDQILRDEYKHNATELANRFGWPKWVVVKRAGQLGLCRVKEKPWTKAEDAFLLEHAGVRTAHWMARQLRTRTETAIVVRLKRLHISRRIQADGLTLGQLEQALGVDHRQIVAWWKSGRLKGAYRENPHEHERFEFQERDVAEFLLKNPSSFRLDRVDQVWFMGVMRTAVNAAAGKLDEESEVTSVASAADRQSQRTPARSAKRIAATDKPADALTACVGVDEGTPCPHQKQVVARPNIPARCPDCRLEIRRQLQREDMERMRRIRASSPPAAVSA